MPAGWLSGRRQTCDEVGTWSYSPTLSKTNGLIDFAGSGVVHMVGGGAGESPFMRHHLMRHHFMRHEGARHERAMQQLCT